MRNNVDAAWTSLRELTEATLNSLSCPEHHRADRPDPPDDWDDVGGLAAVSRENGAGPNHTSRDSGKLLEVLGLLDEAFLNGRISDERYRAMQAWVQQQLGGS
jgi:hypothetical protein